MEVDFEDSEDLNPLCNKLDDCKEGVLVRSEPLRFEFVSGAGFV